MLTKNNNKTTKTKRSPKARKPTPSAKAALGSWKEARPEKVARAKKLVQDPEYPSAKVINSIARLMAKHWSK